MARRGGYDDDLEDYDDEQPNGRSGQREVLDIIPERYDNDADSRTAKKGAHTRLILTVALVLLAIAALGVAARQIFVPDPGAPMPIASVPTITPDQNPIRAKPENPGGMDVPNQDKLIYDRMASGANEPVRETLLPPAEQPAAPPAPQPRPQATIKPAFDAPQPQSTQQAPGQVANQNVPSAPREAVLPDPVPPQPVVPPSAQPQPIVPPTSAPQPIVPPPAPQPVVTPPSQPVPPTPVRPEPAKPAASSSGGRWVAQLAALKTESAAQSEWSRISRANADILGGYSSDVLKVDLGAKGIFWRLRAGPMDETRARSVCAELKKRGQGCIVARK